jgi:hypothetical protein
MTVLANVVEYRGIENTEKEILVSSNKAFRLMEIWVYSWVFGKYTTKIQSRGGSYFYAEILK